MATSSILPTNSLEEFRIQFNNLVSDVSGITASDTVSGDFSVGGDLTVTGTTSFTGSGAGLSAGTTPLTTLDIDGGTDIGAAIVDADLLIIDDGAGGTNRKTTVARLKTYIGGGAGYFFGRSGGEIGGDSTNGLSDIFRVNTATLANNVTIASGTNATATGPLEVSSGVTVTVTGFLAVINSMTVTGTVNVSGELEVI